MDMEKVVLPHNKTLNLYCKSTVALKYAHTQSGEKARFRETAEN